MVEEKHASLKVFDDELVLRQEEFVGTLSEVKGDMLGPLRRLRSRMRR